MVGYHDDGRRKYKSFYARTQKEVKEKVAKYREEQASGLKLDKNLTFADWAKVRPSALFLRDTAQKYVLAGKKAGHFCTPSSFRKLYKTALEELRDVRILSPHCCRHTYVSQLQAKGVPLETIQTLTGHAEIDMTQHYLHVQPEVKTRAVATLNQLF